MKIKIFYLAAALIIFTFLSFAQEMEKRTLKVSKGGNLNVSLSVGDVEIKVSDKDEIVVEYDKDESSNFDVNQSGNNVAIRSSYDSWGNDLMIIVPSQFNITVNTQGGDIKVTGSIKGEISFTTSGGDISLDKITGKVELKSSGGDISTGEITGDAEISTSGGDIALGRISGKAVVETSGGNIAMNSVGKSAEIRTAGGNVAVNDIGGDSEIKTGGGNIAANKINGEAIIKTGGGNISLESATGYIDAETGAGNINIQEAINKFKASTGAGDIYVRISPNIKGDCELRSGTGSITLYVPSSAKVTINAVVKSIGWGDDESSIDSDFPGSIAGMKKHVNQKTFSINGGGSTINVVAALGSIRIKKVQ